MKHASAAPDSSRAWAMAWSLGWTEMISWGILFYAFTALIVPMQDELGWSTGALTGAYSVALLVSGIVAPAIGRRIDSHGARALMTAGSILGSLMMVAWARVDTLPAYYLIWIGIGLAQSLTLYEPAFAAIAPWFQRHRDKAMLIITFFGGLASTVFLPLTGWLEDRFGWRDALLSLAALLAIGTILPHAVVLRGPAWRITQTRARSTTGVRSLMRSAWFRRLSLAFFLQTFTTVGVTVHMIAYLIDQGVSPTTAATIAGAIGLAQTSARVLLTAFGQRVPVETMTSFMFATQVIAILMLVFWPHGGAVWAAALLLGVGRGALTLLRPAILLERYDVREFGAVNGSLAAVLTIANAAAPVLTGFAVTWLGAYQAIFIAFALLSLGSAIALWSTRLVAAPQIERGPASS